MESARQSWKVRNRNRFLLAIMKELAGDAHISFEGDAKILGLVGLLGASQIENTILKRNTLWPKQDFVVIPLEPSTIPAIFTGIGGTIPRSVLHIQIEKNGRIEFGAYDNFNPESIVFGSAISDAFIEALTSEGILKPIKL
jgi:hypothetical protein